jgi:hypothetical protein
MTEESIRHRDSISPPGIRRLTRRPGSRPRYRLPFSGIESVTGDRQSRLEPVQGLRSLGVLPTAQQRFGWEQWPEHVLIVFRKVSCLVSRAAAGVQYRFPASSSYNRSCAGHSINLPHRHRSRRRGGMSNPFPRLFRYTGYFMRLGCFYLLCRLLLGAGVYMDAILADNNLASVRTRVDADAVVADDYA